MALVRALVLALFVPALAYCEQRALSSFGYLNNNESSVIIDDTEAQDLLNVDVTAGGKSIKKREGYGSYKSLGTGQAIHGGYHFFDAAGNDVQIWASSTSLYGIVADGTPTQLVSSGTLNATWDCADTQGFAYCVSSSRDAVIKTNGATKTWYTSPLGTMVEMTPDRLVIAGVAGALSTLYHSKAGDFTNFSVGIDDPDAFTEVIASPGSRITHIRYGCGKLLWWKNRSFGYLLGETQSNVEPVIVSDTVGTQDNDSAIDPGGTVWFRAQDGHIYSYDCQQLEKRSTAITPNIQTAGDRTSNSYNLTTQPDWQSGTIVPTDKLSTTLISGDVVPSSFTATETTAADWAQGTLSSLEIGGNSIIISTLTSTSGWNSWSPGNIGFPSAWSPLTNCGAFTTDKGGDGTILELSNGSSSINLVVSLVDANTNAVITSSTHTYADNSCSWTQRTLTVGSSHGRRRAKLKFSGPTGSPFLTNGFSAAVTLTGGDITYYTKSDIQSGVRHWFVDSNLNVSNAIAEGGLSSISQGTYRSKVYNVGFTPSYASLSYTASLNDFTPAFSIQHASSTNGAWSDLGTAADTSYANAEQYLRFISTFTVSGNDDALTSLDDVTLLARSSGTFYTTVVNRPNLSSWDTLNATYNISGSSVAFYLRSSTSAFTTLSSTPAWTGQTVGSVISIATGTYMQGRVDFAVTASSHAVALNDLTINWFEGSASDKAYATYFSDAIWWSVAYGAGITTNNYIFRYDLLNAGWTLYNFGSNGFLTQNNNLYFGSPSSDSIFRFGGSTSDNGSAINSYWKSKDYSGSDPWVDNTYKQLDVYATRNQNETLTVTYGVGTSTNTTSYNISLSTSSSSVVVHKKLLPIGKNGPTFNVQVGDNSSSSSWEVLGFRFVYDPLSYRPSQ